MLRIAAITAAALFVAPAVHADTLKVRDEGGVEVEIDTAALSGCVMVFDSTGAPFEICRMKKIELTPPTSTRARPGQAPNPAGEAAQVIYVRAVE